MAGPIRIANCSGFYGDRMSAAAEMVAGGPIDVLTGDYLAELTMAILAGARQRDASAGYVATFLDQLEQVLGACVERGIKIVSNAGGLDPDGLAAAVGEVAARLGVDVVVGVVTGDDLMADGGDVAATLAHGATGLLPAERGVELTTANAYLGGWGIAEALKRGADVVVTGRVTDAALVLGPAAHHHGWDRSDWDRLAGAVVAGHVIECGAQATGGNYSFFAEVPGLDHPGFPIAEVEGDGSSVITKHPGTGGIVSIGTVTSQLLYEIEGPRYLNPDVTARFDSIVLDEVGRDRVAISGVRGEPPPATTKVAATGRAGYRNSVTFLLAGLDVEAKAEAVTSALWRATGGRDQYQSVDVRLMRTDHSDPESNEQALAHLKVTVTDPDPERVGRAFSGAAVELALASYPGFALTEPPRGPRPLMLFWPSRTAPRPSLVRVDDDVVSVPPTPGAEGPPSDPVPNPRRRREPGGPHATLAVPIGRVVGARSGDKGGDVNLGVFARSDEAYEWLDDVLTVDRLRQLVPEARALRVDRYPLANLRAVNFVLRGLLGDGVSSATRWDPQAKTLAEYFRSRVIDVPEALLAS